MAELDWRAEVGSCGLGAFGGVDEHLGGDLERSAEREVPFADSGEFDALPVGDVSSLVPGNLLEQVLAASRSEAPSPAREEGPWGEFLERIIAPHRAAPEDPRQAEQKAGIDAAMGRLMRQILHHPDFQALEACWRAAIAL